MSRKVYIIGTGHYVPEDILTTEDLTTLKKSDGEYVFRKLTKEETEMKEAGEEIPEMSPKQIREMIEETKKFSSKKVGIIERRITDKDTSASDLAYEACVNAMEAAAWTAKDVDAVLIGTVTPDYPFPNTAAIVAERLGLSNVPAYDFEAGCSGFIYGLLQAMAFIGSEMFDNVLVIGAECLTKITDYEDRNCILFGDGAGAVAVSSNMHPTGLSGEISSWDWGSDGNQGKNLIQYGGGSRIPASQETIDKRMHAINMNGQAIFKKAINTMRDTALAALEKEEEKIEKENADIPLRKRNVGEMIIESRIFDYPRKWGWMPELPELPDVNVDLLIPHQANVAIIDGVAKRLGVKRKNVYINIDKYGNTSSASIPIALDEAFRSDRIQDRNIVVLAAFGAGLTWGAIVLNWSRYEPPKRKLIGTSKNGAKP